MENADVALLLSETGDLLELTGGNTFKVRAYRQAAQVLDTLPTPVAELIRTGALSEVPTIGHRMAEHIGEILERGDFGEHERVAARVPPESSRSWPCQDWAPRPRPRSGRSSA